ncbi:MAG TPA: outer membrane beta-barrel protein [Longimicrobium sp.]|nr:outer membrane beta-barrel protein [Longimicrobium sp.]
MKKTTFALAALAALAVAPALSAQSGFALKGGYVFNKSKIDDARSSGFESVPSPDGFSIGAEYVLPMGIGIGATAYTEGSARNVDTETTGFAVLAEANYFARLPIIPIRPYVGVHAGVGRYTIEDVRSGATTPEIKDSRTQLGFQLGARWQLTSMVGVDAQYRHVSDQASKDQSPDLERNQFVVGVTLF